MNRSSLLKRLEVEEIEGMLDEAATLLKSPAKYLDAALAAEPSSGIELYERYDNLRKRLHREFPNLTERIPARCYRATYDGLILRPDLNALIHDLETILTLIA
jgi:hypothetical protein